PARQSGYVQETAHALSPKQACPGPPRGTLGASSSRPPRLPTSAWASGVCPLAVASSAQPLASFRGDVGLFVVSRNLPGALLVLRREVNRQESLLAVIGNPLLRQGEVGSSCGRNNRGFPHIFVWHLRLTLPCSVVYPWENWLGDAH